MNAAESTAKNPRYSVMVAVQEAAAVAAYGVGFSARVLRRHTSARGSAEHSGVVQALRQWIENLSLDPRTRHLSKARDHADLEKRMRDWDERRNHSFPYLP